MLHGKIVRSPFPSARMTGVHLEAALAVPGVIAVLSAADVPNNEMHEDVTGLGLDMIDAPVLAVDRVRYAGEPVVLVAAETLEAAEAAAELVEVGYEPEPGVFDAEAALDPSAPLVHDQGNVLTRWHVGPDRIDDALAGADVMVEGEYRTHAVDHAYLEPEAGLGWLEGDGTVVLRVSTQVIEHARDVARILGISQSKVRLIGAYMGGGFGGKEDMTVEPYLALLVWKTGRPVKLAWTRQESLMARPKRHPFAMRYRTGATADGTIVAQDVRIVGDAGAYPLLSARVLFAAMVAAVGPYRVEQARIETLAVFTNNVPNSAFRGFGAMQVVFGYESQMDAVAAELGLDPAELRRRNYLRKGDRLPTGESIETAVAVGETLDRVLGALGPREDAAAGSTVRRGRGFASNMQPYGRAVFFRDQATCWMSLEPDGALIVRAGVTDLGGGQAASLCQIASEVLGVPLDDIAVHIADTHLTPPTGGTFATRQLYMSGNAALKTAVELRDRVAPLAAELLGTRVSDLEFVAGGIRAAGDRDARLSLAELVRACADRGVMTSHLGTFQAEMGEFDPKLGQGRTFPDYTFGTHGVEVDVDVETGVVRLLRYVAAHDVGRAINPLRVEGQIQGGAAQGAGYALMEEIPREDGTALTTLFADYLIPTSLDVPDIEVHVIESGEGKGPFGARGIGEPPIGPPAAAIASAIADAVGVRLRELPMTPERVLRAIQAAGSRGLAG
jgi:CO/xanthine dehydrogenase Mo-binding subunit